MMLKVFDLSDIQFIKHLDFEICLIWPIYAWHSGYNYFNLTNFASILEDKTAVGSMSITFLFYME